MKSKKGKRILAGAIAAVAAAAAVGGGIFAYTKVKRNSNPVSVESVMNLAISGGDVSYSSASGTVSSDYVQEVYSSTDKIVKEVLVTEGQEVKKGDPLLNYDSTLLEITEEKAQHELDQINYDIEDNTKKLAHAKTLTPYVEPVPVTEPETEAETLPESKAELYLYVDGSAVPFAGSGTASDPYRYLIEEGAELDPAFLMKLLGVTAESGTESEVKETNPAEESAAPADENSEEESTSASESASASENSPASESASVKEGSSTEESTSAKESGAQETSTEISSTETQKLTPVYARFEIHEENNENGLLLGGFAVNGQDGMALLTEEYPEEEETEAETVSSTVVSSSAEQYTAEEIKSMIAEYEGNLKDLEISKKEAELALEEAQKNLENATLYSKVDGVIKTLLDEKDAAADNKPFLVVSGGDGWYVTSTVSESQRDQLHVGDTITCSSWETGNMYEAEVIEVSDTPTSNQMSYSDSENPNSSYYPFTAVISGGDDLKSGDYLELSMSFESDTDTSDSLYLYKAYIRSENGQKYVYIADTDTMTLKKQYVTAGGTLWGNYTEVKSGLSMDDYIAFPYGKNVKEGAPVTMPEDAGYDSEETDAEDEYYEEETEEESSDSSVIETEEEVTE